MRKIFFSIAFLLTIGVHAQVRWNAVSQQYVDQYKDIAIEQMKKWKIPASITLAQGLLESGAGRSELTLKGNNHFGIKCHGWTGRTTYHDDDRRQECFRAYDNALQSYEDHSRFLASGSRYKELFTLKVTDYKGWARGLKKAGYATNPNYASQLIDIIELYKLYEYDTAKSYDKFMVSHTTNLNGIEGDAEHTVKMFNKNYYVIARKGDTFRSIGKEFGLNYRRLARYNERDRKDELEEGEVIWLKKKQTKAPKDYKHRMHYVKAGESMYSIAQKYGIRLKNLYKLNHLGPDYDMKVGDSLKLR